MIIMDLDGVMADFVGATCQLFGHPKYVATKWNYFEDWDISADQFWSKIHALGDAFYGELVQPYPWAIDLANLVDEFDDEVVVISAASQHPASYAGKVMWVNKYLNGRWPVIVTPVEYKKWWAAPGVVLIDDRTDTCREFISVGAEAVLFPQPWNCDDAPADRIQYVHECLAVLYSEKELHV